MILHHSAIDSKATLITSHSNFIFQLHILNIGLFIEYHICKIPRMHVIIHEILVKFCYWQGILSLVGTKNGRYPEKIWLSIDCVGQPL